MPGRSSISSVYTIKDLLEINEVYVQTALPLGTLLNDVTNGNDMISTFLSFAEASLFFPELEVYCFRDPQEDNLGQDLAKYGWPRPKYFTCHQILVLNMPLRFCVNPCKQS